LDQLIENSGSSTYRTVLGTPALGIALIGILDRSGGTIITRSLGFAVLVISTSAVMIFVYGQARAILIFAGQRRAIEEFAEKHRLIPRGVFSWEGGPAKEFNAPVRLDGKRNYAGYLQPVLAIALQLGVSVYGLVNLYAVDHVSALFIVSMSVALVAIVTVGIGYREVRHTGQRVYEWTRCELIAGLEPPDTGNRGLRWQPLRTSQVGACTSRTGVGHLACP
jgi:hypothetical protein